MTGISMEYRKKIISTAPSSRGKSNLLKHFNGKRLTQRQAILAKCCDCMGYHADGRIDCRMPHCSLYPFRPYKDEPESKPKQAGKSHRSTPATR